MERDGVAAREDAERRQIVQPRGEARERALLLAQRRRGGGLRPRVEAHQGSTRGGERRPERDAQARVERGQRAPAVLDQRAPHRGEAVREPDQRRAIAREGGARIEPTEAMGERGEARAVLREHAAHGALHVGARGHEPMPHAAERAPRIAHAAREPLEREAVAPDPDLEAALEAAPERVELAAQRGAVRHDQLRRVRRRGRAHVRDEVGDGLVDLVPDAAHDRHRARRDGARHALVVEGAEVVGRAPAAGHDDHVEPRQAAHPADGAHDGERRLGALHLAVRDDQPHRRATGGDAHHVVHGRALLARDEADHAGVARERPLALAREEPLGGELLLQLLELGGAVALARRERHAHEELEGAPRLVERERAQHPHALALDHLRACEARVATEHHRAQLRLLRSVGEREVEVARRGARDLGQLALHPHLAPALHLEAHAPVELGDAVDPRRLRLPHAGHDTSRRGPRRRRPRPALR
ncbi:MAG: hypothetical protein M5U28_42550 [Sandaracinaceae bacterium]|nr:hypothetical protein [Sandaracinaceae bacterium]